MKNMMLKMVAGVAKKTIDSGKNRHSLVYLYQPKMPDQLRKSEK